jgi:outer membrane protein with beta-barrel domain
MRVRKLFFVSMLAVLALAAAPSRASADWYVTPFVGGNFNGNANFGGNNSFDDQVERRVDVGASLGWMGKGIAGAELDWGWSPNFFQNTTGAGNFAFGDSNVTSLMGNLVIGVPVGGSRGGGLRPYVVGGAGLLRSNISANTFFTGLTSNDLGVDVGGGVHGYFNDHVGLRGDLRYFRLVQDNNSSNGVDFALSDFNFWRGSIGVTFRFGN